MLSSFSRFIAIMLLVIPGLLATYGFLQLKEAIFESLGPPTFPWLKFVFGLLCFGIGVAFIGGWILFRDRKHNYVAPRWREKKSKPRSPRS